MQDEERPYAEKAIKEAYKCTSEGGRIRPKVGAVVVKNGTIIGSAYRGELSAGDHAEYTVLETKLGKKALADATVYTTLEPCTVRNHPKSPCADRLAERKVRRVVIGMLDPNPLICGKGLRKLRDHGIATDLFPEDLMKQVEEMNREFAREHERSNIRLSKATEAGLVLFGVSKDTVYELLAKELKGHEILTTQDYESIARPLGNGLFATLTKLGSTITVDRVEKTPVIDADPTLFKKACDSYLNAYALPFRADHKRLFKESEFNMASTIIKDAHFILSGYVWSKPYANEKLYRELHRLKSEISVSITKAEKIYKDYLNGLVDKKVLGQVAIHLDTAISIMHKILIAYPTG